MTTAPPLSTVVPAVAAPRPLRMPKVAEAELGNGLRVLAVRKPSVPRVEVRLITPLGGARNLAAERVLSKTLLSGTGSRDSVAIAQEIQRLGATLGAGIGADHFQASGSVLAHELPGFLALLADVLTDARFPAHEVAIERARVAQELEMARSQPQVLVTESLRRRLFGRHRYGIVLPTPAAVSRVSRSVLADVYARSVGPKGGVVVVVGDIRPADALSLVEQTLGGWRRRVTRPDATAPTISVARQILFVDRPGSVQTSFKIAGPVPKLGTDDYYATDIANTIFGGYFISRWVDNIRERNGYTYSPFSSFVHHQLSDHLEITADVGADVTLAALVETRYELGRMCAAEVSDDELGSAKRYRTGIQSLRIQSQAGLATTLASLMVYELGIGFLQTYPKRIDALTKADIREASERYLAPGKLLTVMVGDAARVVDGLSILGEVKMIR